MTVTEANAVNEIAREVILIAHSSVITPQLECGIATLLINANRALGAGQTPETFLACAMRYAPNPEADLRKARSYVPIVERVLRDTAAAPEIEIHLAIGAACPALTDHDKAIWLYVCRQYDPWIELRQAERIKRLSGAAPGTEIELLQFIGEICAEGVV